MTLTVYRSFAVALSAVALLQASCAQAPATAQTPAAVNKPSTAAATATAPTKLIVIDRKEGDGLTVAGGEPVVVHYSGYLWDASAPDNKGKQFDSSLQRPAPFGFIVGAGRVIKGWDEGLVGMKVGGQRTLIIPADKGYGARGSGETIPPNAALVFDVELMGILGKTQNPQVSPSPYVPAKK